MKRQLLRTLLFGALMISTGGMVHANSWRIHNNPAKKAHFLSIKDACASEKVQNGDTLYLDPGCVLSTNQSVTKRLTVIGTGYCFTDQPYPEATITGTAFDILVDSVKAIGINCKDIYIRANHCTVERCKAQSICLGYSNNESQYAVIRQCYFERVYGQGSTSTVSAYCTIENCIVSRGCSFKCIEFLYSPIIRYNYIRLDCIYNNNYLIGSIDNGSFVSNIIFHTCGNSNKVQNALFTNLTNCQVQQNVLSSEEGAYTAYPENVCLGTTDETAVIACTGANDRYYELADESPAKAIEAGPFYGPFPYVFSGLPFGLPYFQTSTVSAVPRDGKITVNQKVKIQTK